jgi:hypothetical protein
LLAIRELIEHNPNLKRTPLSRRICMLLGWTQPNGALKAMTCRAALLRMQADGLIKLPPSQNPKNGRRPPVPLTAATDPHSPTGTRFDGESACSWLEVRIPDLVAAPAANYAAVTRQQC